MENLDPVSKNPGDCIEPVDQNSSAADLNPGTNFLTNSGTGLMLNSNSGGRILPLSLITSSPLCGFPANVNGLEVLNFLGRKANLEPKDSSTVPCPSICELLLQTAQKSMVMMSSSNLDNHININRSYHNVAAEQNIVSASISLLSNMPSYSLAQISTTMSEKLAAGGVLFLAGNYVDCKGMGQAEVVKCYPDDAAILDILQTQNLVAVGQQSNFLNPPIRIVSNLMEKTEFSVSQPEQVPNFSPTVRSQTSSPPVENCEDGLLVSSESVSKMNNASGLGQTHICDIVPVETDERFSDSTNIQLEMEKFSTREIAQQVAMELRRYSIPQAVFSHVVLGRSQGTLSDLLRNPKPWSKLKAGRETFRRMWKWLKQPEYERLAALHPPSSGQVKGQNSFRLDDGVQKSLKKPRLVFTEIQRRTLVAIFKEIKRPSKEIQATIAEQLGLKTSTVANFFMNARRRSIEKYMDEEPNSEQISNLASVTSSQNSNDMIDHPDSV